ncbi:low molecular weight protein-tyrosine-phosphatase [Salinisphaera sp.]|uniref:low molecular weight protein-tyrosine-phosphatase n=1 Tax=Salinisphaera sp. TaxID=1914330 RepID=UPI002D788895|nr:low molecular weight protein-tyrosine-phosphatase [Salinisphaera sp.]HET7314714.1 low molecular weight protein-tyrosine-phosphatase [Salinisphaera sp.]
MTNPSAEIRVLFVCLGNICRSPTAEAIMRQRLQAAGLADRVRVDSAGTGPWHVGDPPDRRARDAAAGRGYDMSALRGRQVAPADLAAFDYLIAMDEGNRADLCALAGGRGELLERIALLGDFSPIHAGQPVGDPYYGGPNGFERVLDMIETCVEGLIADIRARLDTA